MTVRSKSRSQAQSGKDLIRRSRTCGSEFRKSLPENSFWQQTQHLITPIIEKEAYDPELYVDVELENGYKQSEEISKYLAMRDEPRCLLLVGQPGVGKSSLLQHFCTENKLEGQGWVWIYFNGNLFRSQTDSDLSKLIPCLLNTCCEYLEGYLRYQSLSWSDFLDDLFRSETDYAPDRLLFGEVPDDETRKHVVANLKLSKRLFLESVLKFLSRRTGANKTVFVLDNLDPLSAEIQALAVREILALSVSCRIRTIVSVRRKTEDYLSFHDPVVTTQFIRTNVEPPPLTEVIERRVAMAIAGPEAQEAKLGQGALQFKLRECPEFARVLVRGLGAEGVQRVFEGISNESVRSALRVSLSVYASPELDPRRIVAKLSPAGLIVRDLWSETIPHHIVVRSILLRTSRIYDESIAWVRNIFGTNFTGTHVGPFLRLLILRFLRNRPPEGVSENSVVKELEGTLGIEADYILAELRWLERAVWVNKTARGYIHLTSFGHFVESEFIYHREYLALISCDVDMYPHYEERLRSSPRAFREHFLNLCVLLDYLSTRELEMLLLISKEGSLNRYCRLYGSSGISTRILEVVGANLEPLRSERAIRVGLARLRQVREGENMTELEEVLRRFCPEGKER